MKTNRQLLDASITEANWQKQIVKLAHIYGWTVAHFPKALTEQGYRTAVQFDAKGFPDLVLVKEGTCVIFCECKTERGRLTAEEKKWRDVLTQVIGSIYRLWRPRDYDEAYRFLSGGEDDTYV